MSLTYNGNNFQYVVPQSLPFGEVRRGCYYDAHGNTLTMPHLTNIGWDYLDQLHSAGNGTFTSYYNYDAEGKRTRKVVDKGTVVEHRYYFGEYEIYDKYVNGVLDTERTTVHLNDEQKRFVIIETLTSVTPFVVTERYQYDNHLGSACLELDSSSAIITYEEYYPFGVTSYRSGRTQAETSLKRYKYCGKERDEETGLYYYGMRYYAAWICRFVSVDPLQFKYPHYTPYQYAGNKPITFIDLDGGEEIKPSDELKKEIGILDVYNKISQTSAFKKIQKQVQTVVDYAEFEEIRGNTYVYPRGKSSGGVITINKNFYSPGSDYDKTVLGKTMIHELIHERLSAIIGNYIFQKNEKTYFRKSDFMKDYPGFAESIKKYGWIDDKQSNRGWQHNWMASYGRDDIIETMKYLDKQYSIIRGNKEYTAEDWYNAISFAGLENTDAWNNLSNEKKTLYTKIINEAHEGLISYSILLQEFKAVSRKNDTTNINVNDTIKN